MLRGSLCRLDDEVDGSSESSPWQLSILCQVWLDTCSLVTGSYDSSFTYPNFLLVSVTKYLINGQAHPGRVDDDDSDDASGCSPFLGEGKSQLPQTVPST